MSKITLSINGLTVEAVYPEEDIEKVYLPLLRHLSAMQKKLDRRIIVFLAAPPGCGKSTLGTFLELLSKNDDSLVPLQILGIDGFMYRSSLIKDVVYDEKKGTTLKDMKGVPESFDLEAIKERIKLIKNKDAMWPLYNRKVHEPEDNKIMVKEKIVMIEGNYLLYSKGKWPYLSELCDYRIFITNNQETLKNRLISRKQQGGSSEQEAVDHYWLVDGPNVQRVLENRIKADLEIEYGSDNQIISVKGI